MLGLSSLMTYTSYNHRRQQWRPWFALPDRVRDTNVKEIEMTIYIPDYDNMTYIELDYDNIANLDTFTRELDARFEEWYDNVWDVEEALANYH